MYLSRNKFAIKEWIEFSGDNRIIKFHHLGRPDGLISIHEVFGKEVVYCYNNRRDNLSKIIVKIVWADELKTKKAKEISWVLPSGDGTQNTVVTGIT
jgi:hypothetical protein